MIPIAKENCGRESGLTTTKINAIECIVNKELGYNVKFKIEQQILDKVSSELFANIQNGMVSIYHALKKGRIVIFEYLKDKNKRSNQKESIWQLFWIDIFNYIMSLF